MSLKFLFFIWAIQPFFVSLWAQTGITEVQHIRPAWSPSGQSFAYLSNESGTYQLYLFKTGTRQIRQITKDTANSISQFKWSPDGKKILFLTEEKLNTVNLDGSAMKTVIIKETTPFFFDWHPNGRELTFSCPSPEGIKLCSINLDDLQVNKITTGKSIDRNFDWSHDGQRFVFGSNVDGKFAIYELDLRTSEVNRLTDFSNNSIDPVFSIDGKSISFINDRNGDNVDFDAYIMDSDGSRLIRVSERNGYNLPLWIQNNHEILINSNANGAWEIYRSKMFESKVEKLADGLAFSTEPNGNRILVQISENGQNKIFMMNLNAKSAQLTEIPLHH